MLVKRIGGSRHNSDNRKRGLVKINWSHRSTGVLLACVSLSAAAAVVHLIPNLKHFQDKTGAVATYNTAGNIDEKNAFFQSLGTNGRTCATCHQADQAFSLSAQGVREVYDRTHGDDPLFAAVDGANCPTSTSKSRAAHSLLLDRGLIRVGIDMPTNPQFTIAVVHDPYGCAITSDPKTGLPVVSVYRRPLPSANLRYLSAVMFDGRETLMPLGNAQTLEANMNLDLTDQALSAVMTHAQGAVQPTAEQLAEIVQFELGLTTAQIHDDNAGSLQAHGAGGGPLALSTQAVLPGDQRCSGRRSQRSEVQSQCIFALYRMGKELRLMTSGTTKKRTKHGKRSPPERSCSTLNQRLSPAFAA